MSLSRDDIARIVKHFILSSPPGEIQDVLADVRAIVGDDSLLDEHAPEVFRTYNIEQLVAVAVPGSDKKCVVSKFGELEDGRYLDPRSKQIFSMNHMKQVASGASPSDADTPAEELRSAVQAAMDKYLQDYYDDGTVTVYDKSEGGEPMLVVCVTACRINPSNLWSGRWRAVWKVAVDGRTAQVSGTARVNVHYYEDGNIQLNTSQEQSDVADASDPSRLGEAITETISKLEAKFQTQLEETCQSFSDTTFKALRRKLPITATKFDFSSSAHKLAGEMTGSK